MTKILVVDDNMIHRKLSERLYGLYGQVFLATSGAEAIETIKFHAADQGEMFDLIVLDMLMPDMDGLETLDRIRTWERENCSDKFKIRIVIASHETDPALRQLAEQKGCDHYFAKKMGKSDVEQMMNEIGLSAISNPN